MAIPRYISAGSGFNQPAATATGTMSWPADVSVSDMAILFLGRKNDAFGTITTGNLFTWTEISPPIDVGVSDGMQIKYRVCNGTEDSDNTISIVSTGTGGRRGAQVYIFRGDVGGTWGFDLNNAAAQKYAFQENASLTSQSDLGVSVSGRERLILNFWYFTNAINVGISLSAETGGAWTLANHYDAGSNPSLDLQVCSLTTSGSISNGVGTISVAGLSGVIATALWVAPGVGERTVSATGFVRSFGGGALTIICPSGR